MWSLPSRANQSATFFVYDAKTGCLRDPDAASNEQVEDVDRSLGSGKSQKARAKANGKAMDVFYKAYPGPDKGSIKIRSRVAGCVRWS